ncbi:hypothetical protein STEG23_014136 [Scotinomys teguina]
MDTVSKLLEIIMSNQQILVYSLWTVPVMSLHYTTEQSLWYSLNYVKDDAKHFHHYHHMSTVAVLMGCIMQPREHYKEIAFVAPQIPQYSFPSKKCFRKCYYGTGEMAQQLRAFAVLRKDPSLVPNTPFPDDAFNEDNRFCRQLEEVQNKEAEGRDELLVSRHS